MKPALFLLLLLSASPAAANVDRKWRPMDTAWRDGAKMELALPDWRGVVTGWCDVERCEAGVPGFPVTVPVTPTHWREPSQGPAH